MLGETFTRKAGAHGRWRLRRDDWQRVTLSVRHLRLSFEPAKDVAMAPANECPGVISDLKDADQGILWIYDTQRDTMP